MTTLSDEALDDFGEVNYERGCLAAYRAILQECVRQLLPYGDFNKSQLLAANLTSELSETREKLREVCELVGDTSYPNDLYLPDIIDKHILPYLEED